MFFYKTENHERFPICPPKKLLINNPGDLSGHNSIDLKIASKEKLKI